MSAASETVTGKAVYEAIQVDPEFSAQPKAMQEAMRPYIEHLPELLAGQIADPVTLSSLMKAKVAFLRYCLKNGFIKAAVEAMPDEALGFFDREDLPGVLEDTLSTAIEAAAQIADLALPALQEFLQENGVSEDDIMKSDKVGFRPKAHKLYKAGQLTIGTLLLTQPMIIVKNTD